MRKLMTFLICCLFCNSVAYAEKTDIVAIMLYGGSISYNEWYHNYQTWDTLPADTWGLGVSLEPNGKLINKADTSIGPLYLSNFYLYADQSKTLGIGPNPLLMLKLSDDSIIGAIFAVSGQPGIANKWERITDANNIPVVFINNNQEYFSSLFYSNKIELGWAEGLADKVSIEHILFPDGINDIYLEGYYYGMQASAVPIPGSVILFTAGLIELLFSRKK